MNSINVGCASFNLWFISIRMFLSSDLNLKEKKKPICFTRRHTLDGRQTKRLANLFTEDKKIRIK